MTLPDEIVTGVLPPIGEQTRAGRDLIVGDDKPLAQLGVGEVVATDAGTNACECVLLEWVVLAAVLAEDDGAFALDDAGEQAASTYRGELVGIADQDRLPFRLLDELEQRGERSRLGHRGLIDNQHTTEWEAALIAGQFEQSVQRGGRDAGLVLELLSGYPGRRRTQHRDSCSREGGPDGVGGGRLAGAGQSDDADDAAAAGRDFLDHPLLLRGEDGTVAVLDLGELPRVDRRDVGVAAALDQCQTPPARG